MSWWKKDGETAQVYERRRGDWIAWNATRGHMAVTPQGKDLFADRESVEKALADAGWVIDKSE